MKTEKQKSNNQVMKNHEAVTKKREVVHICFLFPLHPFVIDWFFLPFSNFPNTETIISSEADKKHGSPEAYYRINPSYPVLLLSNGL